MLKTKSKILLTLFLIVLTISSYCFATETTVDDSVSAISETEEDLVTTSEEESTTTSWTNSDLYLCDDKVEISNVVDGNAFVLANEVTITGEIGGDLFVIANKLNVEGGYIYSNLFVCANEVTLNGVVYDVYATCNTFNLNSNAFVYRDMRVAANNVNILGNVRRNANISAKAISFPDESEILGTLIYGNLNYTSSSEISIPEGIVDGNISYNKVAVNEESTSVVDKILSYTLDLFKVLIYTLIISLIFLFAMPKFVEKVSKMNVKNSFTSLGIGFVVLLAFGVFVVASIFLLASKVASSVVVIGLFAFALIAYIGNAIACLFFGNLFTKLLKLEGKFKLILFTLVSALVLWAISLIPYIGSLVSLLIWLFGIGTFLSNVFNKKEKIVE